MECKKCGADLGGHEKAVATICLRVQGNEETRSYYLCHKCNVYSESVCIEEFFTDEITLFSTGPISREKGDIIVEKIRKCPAPEIKCCRCATHREMSR